MAERAIHPKVLARMLGAPNQVPLQVTTAQEAVMVQLRTQQINLALATGKVPPHLSPVTVAVKMALAEPMETVGVQERQYR